MNLILISELLRLSISSLLLPGLDPGPEPGSSNELSHPTLLYPVISDLSKLKISKSSYYTEKGDD